MDCVQSRHRIVPPQKAAKFVVYETRFSIEYHLFLGLSFVGSVRCCTDEVCFFKDLKFFSSVAHELNNHIEPFYSSEDSESGD